MKPIIIIISSSSTISIIVSCHKPFFLVLYFSWTSSDPHLSDFKFNTAVLSVLCLMSQV